MAASVIYAFDARLTGRGNERRSEYWQGFEGMLSAGASIRQPHNY
jgi:hypothetical protein